MADTGIEFAQEVENKYLRAALKELGKTIGELSAKQAFAENIVRGLKNPDIIMNGGPVTVDRIQVMETGEIRLKNTEPVSLEICDKEASKRSNNGQKKETVVAELAEVVNAS